LGALGFGYLADRVGRRKLFVATLIVYSLAAIATATAHSSPAMDTPNLSRALEASASPLV
jgi:MFS family permease